MGLDIGSAKTCALMGELDEDGIKFVAIGATDSKGLRKGLIVNLDATVSSIRRAVEEAESAAGVPVESAILGVAGGHVKGVNSRGGITLGQRARDVVLAEVGGATASFKCAEREDPAVSATVIAPAITTMATAPTPRRRRTYMACSARLRERCAGRRPVSAGRTRGTLAEAPTATDFVRRPCGPIQFPAA